MYKLLIGLLLLSSTAFGFEIPSYRGRVNDFSASLTSDQVRSLNERILQIEKAQKGQYAIALFTTIEDRDIESLSNELFKKWGVGNKAKNDGVLLVLAMKERQMRIEVGYGMEGVIPDAQANRFIQEDLKPNLRKGDVYGALMAYLKHLNEVLILAAAPPVVIPAKVQNNDTTGLGIFLLAILGLGLAGGGLAWYLNKKQEEEREAAAKVERARIEKEHQERMARLAREEKEREERQRTYRATNPIPPPSRYVAPTVVAAAVGVTAASAAALAAEAAKRESDRLAEAERARKRRQREEEEEEERRARRRREESSSSSYSSSDYSSSSSWGSSDGGSFGGGDSGGGGASGSW